MMMKEAFDIFFEKLNRVYEEEFGTKPMIPYSEKWNRDLLVSEPDDEGYVEWEPKLQTDDIDWASIERELGFSLCEELKEFYSTYSFADLDGRYNKMFINFDGVNIKKGVEVMVRDAYEIGKDDFPNSEVFAIVDAQIRDDDGYTLYFDNKDGRLFAREFDTNKTVEVSNSITEVIANMEALI